MNSQGQIPNGTYQTIAFGTALLFLTISYTLYAIPSALAQTPTPSQTVCPPVYGGGTICQNNNLLVDKKVKDPENGDFVNNIELNTASFHPEDHVSFRIFVTNIGNSQLKNITVTDNIPQFLTPVQTPGTYDSTQRRVTMKIDTLDKNETKSFDLEFVISPLSGLGNTAPQFCLSNQAVAQIDTQKSNDTAQICVEKTSVAQSTTKGGLPVATPTPTIPNNTKGGLPVYGQTATDKTPSTGAEALVIPLLGAATGAGIFLRKKARI